MGKTTKKNGRCAADLNKAFANHVLVDGKVDSIKANSSGTAQTSHSPGQKYATLTVRPPAG